MPGKVFLMAGGGTGGHVIPALAVARELQRRGHEPFFVGTERGVEARMVPAAGFHLELVRIGALKRVGAVQRTATLTQLPLSTLHHHRQRNTGDLMRPVSLLLLGLLLDCCRKNPNFKTQVHRRHRRRGKYE